MKMLITLESYIELGMIKEYTVSQSGTLVALVVDGVEMIGVGQHGNNQYIYYVNFENGSQVVLSLKNIDMKFNTLAQKLHAQKIQSILKIV